MNPGPIEEAGQTARSVVSSLASTPVVLALVVFNTLYLGFGFWQVVQQDKTRADLLQTWAHEHETTAQLLAKCIVPHDLKLQSDESHPV